MLRHPELIPMRMRTRRRRESSRLPILGLLILVLLALAPALARAQAAGQDTVVLAWTAPGDDGAIGTASSYEVRVSGAPISESNFDTAFLVPNPPAPTASGNRQRLTVRGLVRGTTYYFAIKTLDDAGNRSGISNMVRWDWVYDTSPPAAPTGLSATRQGADVRVRWSANTEPDLGGYTVYRSVSASGPYDVVSPGLLTGTEFLDTSAPVGADNIWYQVSATDDSGNESARTTYRLSTVSVITAWSMEPAYPNPARIGEAVNVPVVVPGSGDGSAELRIMDSGGRLVRLIELGTLAAGAQSVVWDGDNDAGRPVAPGVYTAWLVAGGSRTSTKLVRVP